MTTLLIDIGNTRLKWGLDTDNGLAFGGACATDVTAIENLYVTDWAELKPTAVFISCVSDTDTGTRISDWAMMRWGVTAQFLTAPQQGCGVINAYTDPERLGSDRWAAMVATRQIIAGAVCVVGCGTAVTFDVLRGDGQHLGGLIIPGYSLMQTSLQTGTRIDFTSGQMNTESRILGQSTETCIENGIHQSICGMIQSAYAKVWADMQDIQLVLTGGDAVRVRQGLGLECRLEPDLVLRGLAIIHRTFITANPL